MGMNAPSKGLGRGLQSLLNPQQRSLYRTGALPMSAIRQGSHQPRTQIHDQPLGCGVDQAGGGIVQPIVVR
jgi:hypothetical protein